MQQTKNHCTLSSKQYKMTLVGRSNNMHSKWLVHHLNLNKVDSVQFRHLQHAFLQSKKS